MIRLVFNVSVSFRNFASKKSQTSLFYKHMSSDAKLENTKQVIKSAKAICFDVDSTVIQEEGIDVLADYKGVGSQVAELTKNAMGGSVSFNHALATRLGLIKPSHKDLYNCLQANPFKLTLGVKKFIMKLHARGTHVYLISGGFRQMIAPIAETLMIPSHRIYANNIIFDSSGEYLGFDAEELTSKDGGKATVIDLLRKVHRYDKIVMIGDGITDLHARPPADIFIGFGGVVVRDAVKDAADWFITDFQVFEFITLNLSLTF